MIEIQPQKLTAFFSKPQPKVSQIQHGVGAAAHQEAYTDLPDENPADSIPQGPPLCPTSRPRGQSHHGQSGEGTHAEGSAADTAHAN